MIYVSLVSVPQVNTKTRHTAFELLVKLAREFESADEDADEDDMMGGAAAGGAQLQVRVCAVTTRAMTPRLLRTKSPSKFTGQRCPWFPR